MVETLGVETGAEESGRGTGDARTVSVVIPTFNRAHLIGETLASVLAQTRPADEIIVIDDGSRDNTRDVVGAFDGPINYRAKPNSGKANSLNVALEMVRGDFVWIVDDDDLAEPGALARLLGLIAENRQAVLAYGRYERFSVDAATGAKQRAPAGHWRMVDDAHFLVTSLEDFYVHQGCMIVRRDAYEAVGPFDPTYVHTEDCDMLIRLARYGPCVGTDEVVFLQRQHDGERGSAAQRYGAADREAIWINSEKAIFERLRGEMALDEFLPRGRTADTDAARREALIQRATIMGRKKLWAFAVEDLKAAAAIDCGALSEAERDCLRRAMGSKFGCNELLTDRDAVTAIAGVAREGTVGRAMVRTLGRGLVWRVREAASAARPGEAFGFARLAARFST